MPSGEGVLAALERVADFGCSLSVTSIPSGVAAHAPYVVLDTIGTVLGGSTRREPTSLADIVATTEVGDASVLRHGLPRVRPAIAALLNGTAAVWLELDPGHSQYRTHAAAHVLPAALATAEHLGASGGDFIAAFIAGCEIAYRVGGAIRPLPEVNAHGTWPVVGAAAAVARLYELDGRTFARALGLACHVALAATFRASPGGATVRNAFVGLGSELAMHAVWLARSGFTPLDAAPDEVFGKILGTDFDPTVLTAGLGEEYEFVRDFVKFYACCHHLYGALEGANEILQRQSLVAEEIGEILVRTYRHAARFDQTRPANELAAKFSLPYALAVRIVRGDAGPSAFVGEALQDSRVLALAARVKVLEDPAMTSAYPRLQQANVEIRTTRGERYAATGFGHPVGAEASEPSLTARLAKFEALAQSALPAPAVSVLRDRVIEMRSARRVAEMLDDVRQAAATA